MIAEEAQVAPARASTSAGFRLRSRPAITPGVALRTRSTTADG